MIDLGVILQVEGDRPARIERDFHACRGDSFDRAQHSVLHGETPVVLQHHDAVADGEGPLADGRLHRHILAEMPGPQDPGPMAAVANSLSQREVEVLQMFADGCSTVEVGQRLYISAKTVKNHLASIYEKLDARDRTQAVLTAVRMGIIRLN